VRQAFGQDEFFESEQESGSDAKEDEHGMSEDDDDEDGDDGSGMDVDDLEDDTEFAALNGLEEASSASEEPELDPTEQDSTFFEHPVASTSNEEVTSFAELPNAKLSRPILLGLASMGLHVPTPVQVQTIPCVLLGKDVVGSAVTGSGKTVAFWCGVLERLLYRDKRTPATRVIAICPTRELAQQVLNVGKALARYTDITFALCVGGLSLKVQESELKQRPDVVVCTPGRLIDHVRNTQSFTLDSLEILIMFAILRLRLMCTEHRN
jgi:ATP-dependent RNA helicase DDX27